jgi:soluble lytic murein transglycosylase-like protein
MSDLRRLALPAPVSRRVILTAPLALAACGVVRRRPDPVAPVPSDLNPGETPEMRTLIRTYASVHGIPESLLHRVIQRESDYNAAARNGPYYGLMQILPQTARTMGYDGPPEGLLDAETNLIYAGRYLRGAWIVAEGDEAEAVGWYARGYYYEAKRKGLLVETGLRAG